MALVHGIYDTVCETHQVVAMSLDCFVALMFGSVLTNINSKMSDNGFALLAIEIPVVKSPYESNALRSAVCLVCAGALVFGLASREIPGTQPGWNEDESVIDKIIREGRAKETEQHKLNEALQYMMNNQGP